MRYRFCCVAVISIVLPAVTYCADANVSFIRDVAPLLVARCEGCHGGKKAESSYRLDTFDLLVKAGDFGEPPITANQPDESLLLRLIESESEDERMPKDGDPLPADEIGRVRRWIEQGAAFDGTDPASPLAAQIPRAPAPKPPSAYSLPMVITALAITPDGNRIVAGGYHELTVWDFATGELVSRIEDMAQRTYAIAYSPDGNWVAVAGGIPGVSGEVRLLRAADFSPVHLLGRSTDVVHDVAFRPDGQQVAAAFADQSIRIYDVASGTEKLKLESHADWVMAVAWNADGSRLVSASRDKTAKLFDSATGDLLTTYSGHGQPVADVAFSSDSKQMFSCGDDKLVHCWNPDDGKKIADVTAHAGEVYKLVVADGEIFTAAADRSVRQFHTADRAAVRTFENHPDAVTALAVDLARKRLVTGCFDGHLRVWNLEDGNNLLHFMAAPGYVQQ